MWLLVSYITVWTVSPGPVFIKIIQEVRKHGLRAGITIATGATFTAILMVISGLIIHSTGFLTILDSSGVFMVEQISAIGIILMGVYAGFKCLLKAQDIEAANSEFDTGTQAYTRAGFVQGMFVMATGIPQALLCYNIIIPRTVELEAVTTTIIGLGALNIAMVFGFYSLVAIITGRSQGLVRNNRFKKVLDFSLATMLVGMGVNILF